MTRTEKLLPVVCVLLLAFATNHAATSANQKTLDDILETVKNIARSMSEKIRYESSIETESDDIISGNRNVNADSNVNVNSNANSNVFRRKESSRKRYIDDVPNEIDNNEVYRGVGQRRMQMKNRLSRSQDIGILPARMVENYGKLNSYKKLMDQSNMNLNTNTNYLPTRRTNAGNENQNLNYNANSNFNLLRKQSDHNDHSAEDDDDDDEFRRAIVKKSKRKSKKRITGNRMEENENSNMNYNINSNSNLNRRRNSNSNKSWNMNVDQNALDRVDFADYDVNLL